MPSTAASLVSEMKFTHLSINERLGDHGQGKCGDCDNPREGDHTDEADSSLHDNVSLGIDSPLRRFANLT